MAVLSIQGTGCRRGCRCPCRCDVSHPRLGITVETTFPCAAVLLSKKRADTRRPVSWHVEGVVCKLRLVYSSNIVLTVEKMS